MKRMIKNTYIYGMSNLWPEKTGLKFPIWVDSSGNERNNKHHEFRIKAKNNDVEVEVGMIDGEYTTFKTSSDSLSKFRRGSELKKYVTKMKEPFEMHWNREISDGELERIAEYVRIGKDVVYAIQKVLSERIQ